MKPEIYTVYDLVDTEIMTETYKYALQRKGINTHIRKELLCNMTNLPESWKEVALSNDLDGLTKLVDLNHRVINRNNLEIVVNTQ